MNYREAREYLDSYNTLGSKPGLDCVTELCRRLGNPQDRLPYIHVAGTNGKGSVSAFTEAILRKAGLRVGKYTSPAVFEYEERYRVAGKNIGKAKLGELMTRVAEAADSMERDGRNHPTVFEMETALAFLFFVDRGAQVGILECGMGGTLDATNLVTTTRVAVFASISFDHMAFLGDTLPEIARSKSGIIKPGVIVVSAPQEPCVSEVLRKVTREVSGEAASLYREVKRDDLTKVNYGERKTTFAYRNDKNLAIDLRGTYQPENAAVAMEAALAYGECIAAGAADGKNPITAQVLREGLKEAVWPGRFETIAKKPLFILDGAHNEDAAKRLRETVENYFTNKRIIYIMGMLKDKEVEKVVARMAPLALQIITVTPPNNPRGMQALDLAKIASEVHASVTSADSLEEAVELARLLAGEDGIILAFGSLSYLGRLRTIVQESLEIPKKRK